ncbi:lysozyme [Trichophyton violaceum]|uniref:Lysozyme n=1 Tax=Trichophyton violaceum TaxID=34388 RepID=A0A178F6L2_TRIVO|nr:lysozyme [Trichophyton violaceum]
MSRLSLLMFVGLAALACVLQGEAKTFNRCELAKELKKQGFAKENLPDWVCLVEAESSRRSHKIGKVNKNGSQDFGLFQINDRYWCQRGSAGKDCNVSCEDLLTDDISVASRCAQKVYKRHKFDAWYGWKNKCQGSLPDLSSCGIE